MGPCGKGWADSGAADSGAASAGQVTRAPSAAATVSVPVPSRSACVYTSHYCEENVLCLYRDIANAAEAAGATLYVVFVSNQARQVPVWCQVLAESYNKPVLWDYHVMLLAHHPHGNWIYDLDSTLQFPTPASHYVTHAFHGTTSMDDKYRQVFRVVPALECLQHFASNRSHMRSPNGQYSAQPPNHPPLRGPRATTDHNMEEWIRMDGSTGRGNSRDHVAGFKPPMYHRSSFNVQRCSSRPTDRKKTRQCNALVLHMTAVNDDQSNSEGDFNSSEAEFERRLELDAQAWAGGDPGRLQWWESAKAWRRREKMRQVRAEAMSELERDKLRYVLSDVQRLTGLPLVDNDKNKIKPLAWFMTIVIQLMPIALVFVIFDALHPMGDTEPVQVFDMTRPFWS